MDRIIKADGTIIATAPQNGTDYQLGELKDIVQGYIEIISDRNGKEIMVLNEEGKLMGLPINATATQWLKERTNIVDDYVVGDVLVCDAKHVK